MKRIILLITAIAVMFGGMAFVTPVANASEQSSGTSAEDTPEDCEAQDGSTGNGECGYVEESESHSSSGGKSKSVSRNGVSISSHVTVLANVRAEGTPRDQQDNCWHLASARSIWTSYDASGSTGWHWKSYPKGYRVCTMDNGKVRDPNCHNILDLKRPKSKPPKNAVFGKVKFVKRIHWKVVSVSEADELAVAKAKAWCNTSSASAFAQAKGSAVARASARAVAKGYVLVKVMARAEAASNHAVAIQLGAESLIQVRVNTRTEAVAKAKAEASAKVSCSDAPPAHDECPDIPGDQPEGYDCNPPPPVDHKPAVNIMGSPAHLYVGGNAYIWIEASDPDGDPVSVQVSASGAGTVSGLVPSSVRWDGTPCPTGKTCYRATAWAGSTPGNMTITATVTANGVAGDPDSVTFPVKADEF